MAGELEATRDVVKALAEFDSGKLVRESDLGATYNFAAAVTPANKLISLFKTIRLKSLEGLPPAHLASIRQIAEQVMMLFKQILDFSFDGSSPAQLRTQYIAQLTAYYDSSAIPTLFSYIGYGAARTSDFARLEAEARDSIAAIGKQTEGLQREIKAGAEEAKKMLEDIRAVAAEQGVSQEAIYFKNEADRHDADAKRWRTGTICLAISLGLFALLTMFSNHIPGLQPENAVESSQIIAGKVLVFVVIAYMLLLSARNFLSHVHNGIVNRHRQNALLTFNALANAGGTQATKDVVLGYAASCIYAPQETGYAKGIPSETTLPQALISMVTKTEAK